MPLVRINLSKSYSPEQRQIVSDVVYTAMIEIANVPEHDKFQIFTPHSDGELVYRSCPSILAAWRPPGR
jgi:4-oxalocrotonate tautomerase